MRRFNKPVGDCRTGVRSWGALRPGLPPWGVLAVLGLAVPWWGWGQSNALNRAAQPAGAPIRLSALHPEIDPRIATRGGDRCIHARRRVEPRDELRACVIHAVNGTEAAPAGNIGSDARFAAP